MSTETGIVQLCQEQGLLIGIALIIWGLLQKLWLVLTSGFLFACGSLLLFHSGDAFFNGYLLVTAASFMLGQVLVIAGVRQKSPHFLAGGILAFAWVFFSVCLFSGC